MKQCFAASNSLDLYSKCICSSMFLILAGYCMCNFVKIGELRHQPQETRFSACLAISMSICITSCLLGVIQLTDIDDIYHELDGIMVKKFDACKYLEWFMTCPLMQAQLVIFAGPKASRVGSYQTICYTLGTLTFGFFASLLSQEKAIWKCVFFMIASGCFALMARTLDQILRHATDNTSSFFFGSSPLRYLFVFLVVSWLVFPFLWILSPEGFLAGHQELQDEGIDANFFISFANVAAKVLFVVGMQLAKAQLRAADALEEGKAAAVGKYRIDQVQDEQEDWFPEKEEPSSKAEVSALVMQVCCEHGAGRSLAKNILDKMEAESVHDVETIASMASTDLAAMGVPAGLRVWLQEKAQVKQRMDTQSPRGSRRGGQGSPSSGMSQHGSPKSLSRCPSAAESWHSVAPSHTLSASNFKVIIGDEQQEEFTIDCSSPKLTPKRSGRRVSLPGYSPEMRPKCLGRRNSAPDVTYSLGPPQGDSFTTIGEESQRNSWAEGPSDPSSERSNTDVNSEPRQLSKASVEGIKMQRQFSKASVEGSTKSTEVGTLPNNDSRATSYDSDFTYANFVATKEEHDDGLALYYASGCSSEPNAQVQRADSLLPTGAERQAHRII
mmetsp:Transcript_22835/g.48659  ORF Transcript_22835/g.48659 Transcript_22835/m.48659 type:complete len:612 (+) Transcript_22835:90-1925(+)